MPRILLLLIYTAGVSKPAPFETELQHLEERTQRLVAAYQQARLERHKMMQERDRLIAINAELRKRIESVIDRIKLMEAA